MHRARRLIRAITYAAIVQCALAASVHDFEQPGPFAQPTLASDAVAIADGGAAREAGELVIQYSATAAAAATSEGLPLVVFLFPIHGFPFNAWRNLLGGLIRTLCSHGFAVATPRRIGVGARAFSGGLFPGASSTANGMDLREIATRYVNFMTHAVEYVADLAQTGSLAAPVDARLIGFAGFSVGGALTQYTAQRVDARMPGRVACVLAIAPTIGSEDVNDVNDDIGAQLYQAFAASMTIPTVFVAGVNDRMGGYRDSALYYRDSHAPRVRVIAGSGATHCHAVVPMSECDVTLGTRGVDVLDGILASAMMSLYLRSADDPRYAAQRAVAEDIIWRDGLRELESSRGTLVPANRRWTVDAIERSPEISLALNDYSVSAPVAPASVEIIAVVESTLVALDGAGSSCAPRVSVTDVPDGLNARVEQLNAREFAIRVQWFDIRSETGRRGRNRSGAFVNDAFNFVMQTMGVSSSFGPRAAPPRRAVTVTARHGCVNAGVAAAVVFVNQPLL